MKVLTTGNIKQFYICVSHERRIIKNALLNIGIQLWNKALKDDRGRLEHAQFTDPSPTRNQPST